MKFDLLIIPPDGGLHEVCLYSHFNEEKHFLSFGFLFFLWIQDCSIVYSFNTYTYFSLMNVHNAAKNTKNVFLCLISNFVFIFLSRHELTSFDCLSLLQLYLTHLRDFFSEEAAYVDCWYVFILQLIKLVHIIQFSKY